MLKKGEPLRLKGFGHEDGEIVGRISSVVRTADNSFTVSIKLLNTKVTIKPLHVKLWWWWHNVKVTARRIWTKTQ